jgi:hypothetical protein
MRAAVAVSILSLACVNLASATTVNIPTIITFGHADVIVPVLVSGGEVILGGTLDVEVQPGSGITVAGVTLDGETIWPDATPVLASPPSPALPATRTVLNFGNLSRGAIANGVLLRLQLDVPEDGPAGVFVILTNAQFSVINQPPPDVVQADTVWLFGFLVVLPNLGDDFAEFGESIGHALIYLVGQFFGG